MKSLLSAIILSLNVSIALAQFHIGVKAGVGINDFHWNEQLASNGTKAMTSIHIGVFSKLKITNKLSLIPELQYITKGNSTNEDTASGMEAYKLKINYIELPVLINYQLIKWLSVEAGPSLGVKIVAKTVSDSGKSDFINDYIESTDFGINGGLRFYPIDKLSLIARYNYGLSAVEKYNVNHGPSVGSDTDIKSFNRSIQFSIAYQIR